MQIARPNYPGVVHFAHFSCGNSQSASGTERSLEGNSDFATSATVSRPAGPVEVARGLIFILRVKTFVTGVSRPSSLSHQSNNATAE